MLAGYSARMYCQSQSFAHHEQRRDATDLDGLRSTPTIVRPPPKKELVKHERSAGPFAGLVVSYISAERQVPPDHPLQSIRVMVDAALKELGPRFHAIYANNGRPSIPPDKPCGRCCCRCSIARA